MGVILVKLTLNVVGTMPAIFIMESMMDHLARSLKLDVEAVKKANLYQQGQVINGLHDMTYLLCALTSSLFLTHGR